MVNSYPTLNNKLVAFSQIRIINVTLIILFPLCCSNIYTKSNDNAMEFRKRKMWLIKLLVHGNVFVYITIL